MINKYIYYKNDFITLYHGDCLKILQEFNNKSFDLCLTDPHYNAKDIGPSHKKYINHIQNYLSKKNIKNFVIVGFRL